MKWLTIHPQQDTYSFKSSDGLVQFAQAHGMKVRGHVLVGDTNYPNWLISGNFSSALNATLRDHIFTVVGRYDGSIYAWDVANEAFDSQGNIIDSLWYNQPGIGLSGTGYIEQALSWVAYCRSPSSALL